MAGANLTIEQLLTMLAATPQRIAALAADLPPAALRTAPAPHAWSPNDVLAHLRSCADVWGGYILRILAEDRPTIRAISPRTWIRQTNYPQLEFQSSLLAFTTQRAELLAVLQPLPPDCWSRAASVRKDGKVREQSLLTYAQGLALHEQPHLEQIASVVNSGIAIAAQIQGS